jgi:amino acid transporter
MQSKIKIATATIVGMNAMIGSGIFTLPGALIFSVGPAGLLTTLFVSCAVWFMALTLAKVAEQHPQEGSFYAYAKSWGGHKAGLAASISFLIGLTIAMGLLCQVAGIFLNHYFPNTSPTNLGLITLIAVILANMFGVKLSELGQYILIVLTVFPLLATILLCLTNIKPELLQPFAPFGKSSILLASKDVIFSFFGFECATTLFNIVENPKKNVPRALTYSILLVSILYIAFAAAIISAIPAQNFNSPDDLPNALLKTFPQYPWLIELIAISIISAIIGTVHSMVWASGSLVKTLSNQIFKNNIFKTTERSVLAIGFGILATFMLLNERRLFFDLTAIFIIFAYVMSMLALVFTNKKFSLKTNIETMLGITTAMIIIGFAIHDLLIILQ